MPGRVADCRVRGILPVARMKLTLKIDYGCMELAMWGSLSRARRPTLSCCLGMASRVIVRRPSFGHDAGKKERDVAKLRARGGGS